MIQNLFNCPKFRPTLSPLQLVSPPPSGIDGKPINLGKFVTFGEFCETVLVRNLSFPFLKFDL